MSLTEIDLLPIIRTRLHAETRQRALLQDVQKEHDKKVDWFKKHCFPDSLMNDPSSDNVFTIKEIVPQAKEGGLFVKYRSSDPTRVQTEIKEHLKREKLYAQPRLFFKKPVKGFPFRGNPWLQELFLPKSVKMFPVRGVPWIEDMDRFPNKRLRVEFVSGEGTLTQEIIYYLFRRYGKIADIIPQPAPPKHSGLPQFVVIKFRKIRGATAAKGCLNGFKTTDGNGNEVMLRVLYGRGFRFRWAGDWIANNLRFSIPLILTVVGLVAVWIFDPIRARNVKARITGSFDFSQKYIKEKLNTLSKLKTFITTHVPGQKETEPEDTMADLERFKTWLDKTAIVVYGHRCGKLDLIKDVVLKDRKHVLVIDCKPIAEAPSDREMIIEIADQIGYRPLFSWLNNLSELALRAAMGSSGGAEYSTETKLGGIFQVMRNAFKELALRSKSGNVSDEEYLHQNPGERPVLVIDNFLHNESGSIIYEKLAEW